MGARAVGYHLAFPHALPAQSGERFTFEAAGGVDYNRTGFVGPDGSASVIDDGGPGFTTAGTGWHPLDHGFGNSHLRAAAGAGADAAVWRTAGLPDGSYSVSATWPP